MQKTIYFDTLEYTEQLKAGDVPHANVHAQSLSQALETNIYSKSEVDSMLQDELKSFNERTAEIRAETIAMKHEFEIARRKSELKTEKDLAEFRQEMHQIENRLDKRMSQHLIITLTVLGSLIVAMGSLASFSHYFI